MPRFFCCEAKIDRQEHGADMTDREGDLKKCSGVLHENRNHVAGLDPFLDKQCCDLPDPIAKGAVTDALLAINHRKTVGRYARVVGDEGAQIYHRTIPGPNGPEAQCATTQAAALYYSTPIWVFGQCPRAERKLAPSQAHVRTMIRTTPRRNDRFGSI